MSQTEAPAPAYRSTLCSRCGREVLAFADVPDPVECEYCSGKVKPFHQEQAERRQAERESQEREASVEFLERVDAVLTRALPRPDRPAAFGRCPDCKLAYVLIGERIVHPGTCLAAIGGKRDHD